MESRSKNLQQGKYSYGIDLYRGFLLIVVIIIHILNNDWRSHLSSYILYSFVMPLLLSLSGFLLNHIHIETLSFSVMIINSFFISSFYLIIFSRLEARRVFFLK